MKSLLPKLILCALLCIGQFTTLLAQAGAALDFDGVDDYVSITRPVSDDFTIEFWMKTDQTGGNPADAWYLGKGLVDGERPGVVEDFGISMTGGKLAFGVYSPTIHSISNINTGIWVHVAVTRHRASGAMQLFINGVLEATGTSSTNALTAPSNLHLGKILAGTNYYQGQLDEIRLWNRVLPACEIQNNQNCELNGASQTGLGAYYPCNQGMGGGTNAGITTLTDAQSAYAGTLNGFALTGTASNFVTSVRVLAATACAPITVLPSTVSISATATTLAYGTNVTFTATPTNGGTTPTFQWQKNGANVGTNAATYSDAGLRNGDIVRCFLTPSSEICKTSSVSNALTLTMLPTIRYAKSIGSGTGDGSSWANASGNLQAMINASAPDDAIWVAAGTYKPTAYPRGCINCSSNRDYTFHLKNEVQLYGGFIGTETNLTDRDWVTQVTTLSGDIETVDDNVFHVVLSVKNGNRTVLDGFTVTGGQANGSLSITVEEISIYPRLGSGMVNASSSPTINNCTFSENMLSDIGGGMVNASSSPTINNCTFSGNNAIRGGGMANLGSSLTISNSVFSGNNANNSGGMHNSDTNLTISNSLFVNNNATVNGGGMENSGGSSAISNCSFVNNNANNNGGGVINSGSAFTLRNSIIWGNTSSGTTGLVVSGGSAAVTHSILQGSDADPLFANAANPAGADGIFRTADDGLRLGACSPAIDAGTNTSAPTLDILGNAIFTTKDIGAYERQTEACPIYSGAATCQTFMATNVTGNQWFKIVGTVGIVASINPNGSDLGTITIEISDPTGVISYGGNPFLGRTVNITSSNYPSGATIPNHYTLKLYYFDSELTEYGAGATLSQLGFLWKEGGTGCTLATYAETRKGSLLAANVTKAEYGASDNGFSLAFQLNHFTLFAATASSAVLPVELVNFNGQQTENGNQLTWQTASETRFSHFDVERSVDGTRFEKIGVLKAKGSHSNYTFMDPNPFNTMYYRLKINDLDGTFEFSKIMSIEMQSSSSVRVKPTFVNDVLTVEGAVSYEIVDGTGRVLLQSLENQLNVQSLPQGFYVVRGRDVGGNPFVQKIIKK
jgi:Concanavalin A-like lectin/glucanases superfamily